MAKVRISQTNAQVDLESTAPPRRITQLMVEVDVSSVPMPRRITQLLIEVDLEQPTGRVQGPTVAQI